MIDWRHTFLEEMAQGWYSIQAITPLVSARKSSDVVSKAWDKERRATPYR